jgi:lactoylglutathione lyase
LTQAGRRGGRDTAEIGRTGASASISTLPAETRTFELRTIRPGVRIAFVRGPQNVSIEILDRDVA